jgi:NAD(P)H-dependent FMN reductase
MAAPTILAFAGSLRRGSFNRRLVKVAASGARSAGAVVTELDLREFPVPVYDGDLEAAEGLRRMRSNFKTSFSSIRACLLHRRNTTAR